MPTTAMPSGSNPSETRSDAPIALRARRPASTSSGTVTANCTATSASRRTQRRPPARATATAPFKSRTTFGRVAPSAGTRPAVTPAPAANPAVNRKARASRRKSKVIGNGPTGSSDTTAARVKPGFRRAPRSA